MPIRKYDMSKFSSYLSILMLWLVNAVIWWLPYCVFSSARRKSCGAYWHLEELLCFVSFGCQKPTSGFMVVLCRLMSLEVINGLSSSVLIFLLCLLSVRRILLLVELPEMVRHKLLKQTRNVEKVRSAVLQIYHLVARRQLAWILLIWYLFWVAALNFYI